jgi:hypothetical protein
LELPYRLGVSQLFQKGVGANWSKSRGGNGPCIE